jgi:glycosyltransferase involved in cell wall biosynthesis
VRIAVASWSARRVGGVEDYLTRVIPALTSAGHQVVFWSEVDAPLDRAPIAPTDNVPKFCAAELGCAEAIARLRAWCPDLIYVHGLQDPQIERQLLDIAPAVCFAHNYYGTCISGGKTFKNPTMTPCDRVFGEACLVQYYPRRCGGWNPITMVREFRRQADRLKLLAQYKAILTLSSHMQQEYVRHGLSATRVFDVWCEGDSQPVPKARAMPSASTDNRWRLLFVGRMEALKGGLHLLEALPTVARALDRPVHVTFAGDGRDRHRWQERAATVCAREPRVTGEFPGWITGRDLDRLFESSDLLVVPSLWPEPFALIGLQAAKHGLPSAAFAVGGISDWLRSGVNGQLADANPPTAESLARAIIECLKDPETHARLREGAGRVSPELVYERHVQTLLRIFDQVSRTGATAEGHATVVRAH